MKINLNRLSKTPTLTLYHADISSVMPLQYVEGIQAGFPSPPEDYMELAIDLNKELVKNPNATFYGRVKGNSMTEAEILKEMCL